MNEQPTAREIRDAIREQMATTPLNVDHNGKSDLDRQTDTDRFARFSEAETQVIPEVSPAQTGMRANALQGSTGATVPAPPPNNVLDAVRAKAAQLDL